MAKRPASSPARGRAWPWETVALELHEVQAIKAIPAATLAVIEKICRVGENPFTAGGSEGQRATDFGCGQLWVGHTLRSVHAMRLPEPRQQASGAHAVPKGAPPEI